MAPLHPARPSFDAANEKRLELVATDFIHDHRNTDLARLVEVGRSKEWFGSADSTLLFENRAKRGGFAYLLQSFSCAARVNHSSFRLSSTI